MKPLSPSDALDYLSKRIEHPILSVGGTVLNGALQRRRMRSRTFPTGLTVALALTRPLRQANDACLMLAATPEACDDALYVADSRLWLLRRYPPALQPVEFDLLLKQQQTLAALLDDGRHGAPAASPAVGQYA